MSSIMFSRQKGQYGTNLDRMVGSGFTGSQNIEERASSSNRV